MSDQSGEINITLDVCDQLGDRIVIVDMSDQAFQEFAKVDTSHQSGEKIVTVDISDQSWGGIITIVILRRVVGPAAPHHPLPAGLHPDRCVLQGGVVRTFTDTHWVGRHSY